MILLVNPRATRPQNRRFPLSLMALGAALPEGMRWEIIDGNRPGVDIFEEVAGRIDAAAGGRDPVKLVAMTVMPGPQLVHAVPLAKRVKQQYPALPIVWGGYFPSLYPEPVLNAPYVDWAVRGQGEQTLVELLDVIDGRRDPMSVSGLAFARDGSHFIGAERRWIGPDDLPPPPYDKIDVDDYLPATHLGRRGAVYQASIGCPYGCNFCGVIAAFGSREKWEDPARTSANLRYLVERHGADSVHFYDSNFFMKEDHAREIAERLLSLELSWWCEARADAMLRFSDRTWDLLARSGLRMVYMGAESGSDARLARMSKKLTTDKIVAVAEKGRAFGIVPEFSFLFGDPADPEGDVEDTLRFIRKLKRVNPDCEIILYFYTPTPQRSGTYGNADPLAGTPVALEDWIQPAWVKWMTHVDPHLPWMSPRLKARVENFELVLKSRFPSVHDTRTRRWGKLVGRVLAKRHWERSDYDDPRLLRAVRRLARTEPEDKQAYGHLRPAPEPTG